MDTQAGWRRAVREHTHTIDDMQIEELSITVNCINVEFDSYKGTTPPGGDDPSEVEFAFTDFDFEWIDHFEAPVSAPGLFSTDCIPSFRRMIYDHLEERLFESVCEG